MKYLMQTCIFSTSSKSLPVFLIMIMSPTLEVGGGGGHIVLVWILPASVSASVSYLHSISLMNGWILAKLTQIYHWGGGGGGGGEGEGGKGNAD